MTTTFKPTTRGHRAAEAVAKERRGEPLTAVDLEALAFYEHHPDPDTCEAIDRLSRALTEGGPPAEIEALAAELPERRWQEL